METPYDNLNDEELIKMFNYVAQKNNTSVEVVINILKTSYMYYMNNIHSQ